MPNDPIVEEVRRVRDEHARKFNYDLHAIAEDLRRQQAENGRQVVTLHPKKPIILAPVKLENKK